MTNVISLKRCVLIETKEDFTRARKMCPPYKLNAFILHPYFYGRGCEHSHSTQYRRHSIEYDNIEMVNENFVDYEFFWVGLNESKNKDLKKCLIKKIWDEYENNFDVYNKKYVYFVLSTTEDIEDIIYLEKCLWQCSQETYNYDHATMSWFFNSVEKDSKLTSCEGFVLRDIKLIFNSEKIKHLVFSGEVANYESLIYNNAY